MELQRGDWRTLSIWMCHSEREPQPGLPRSAEVALGWSSAFESKNLFVTLNARTEKDRSTESSKRHIFYQVYFCLGSSAAASSRTFRIHSFRSVFCRFPTSAAARMSMR